MIKTKIKLRAVGFSLAVLWATDALAAPAPRPRNREETPRILSPLPRAVSEPVATDAEQVSITAREVLARLPAEARLAEIDDADLRQAVQETYHAVAALAAMRDAKEFAALNQKFENAYAVFLRQAGRGRYRTCIENCRATDGAPCLKRCKTGGASGCGCKLIVFGCIVAECIF